MAVFPGSCGLHSICLRHLLRYASVRACQGGRACDLIPRTRALSASVLLLCACGNSTHNPIVCAGTNTCVLQNFVYATTNASQVLPYFRLGNRTGRCSLPCLSLVCECRRHYCGFAAIRESFSSAITSWIKCRPLSSTAINIWLRRDLRTPEDQDQVCWKT